jgi:Reverse transcriptase (RNA-dependent DNA polymerase)
MEWLTNRSGYVESGDESSTYFDIGQGTIQGSVLGPVLFSLFIDPIFDLIEELLAYADDSYAYSIGNEVSEVENNLKEKVTRLLDWYDSMSMIVNIKKTEYTVFNKKEHLQSIVLIRDEQIASKDSMRVLGIEFDDQLNWNKHIEFVINASKTSCYGLNHLRKFFEQDEMISIATSLAYSRFYYGSNVWYGPMTHRLYKKRLKSASVGIIKSALGLFDWYISYDDLHEVSGRGTPEQFSNYQHALAYFDIINNRIPDTLYHKIIAKSLSNSRTNTLIIPATNKTRIGLNSLDNRLNHVSKLIPSNLLEQSKESFKRFAKAKFLN